LETAFCKPHNGCGLANWFEHETDLSASVNGTPTVEKAKNVYIRETMWLNSLMFFSLQLIDVQ